MATFASVTIYTVGPIQSAGVSQAAQGSDGRIWCYLSKSPSANFVAVSPGGAVTSYSGTYEGESVTAVADSDAFAIVVSSISGTPDGLSLSLYFDVTP